MSDINLVPASYRVSCMRRKALKLWAVAASVLAVACALTILMEQARNGAGGHSAEQEQVTDAQQQLEQIDAKISQIQVALQASQRQSTTVGAAAGQPDWQQLLVLVSWQLGDKAVLTRCALGSETSQAILPALAAEDLQESNWLILEGMAEGYSDVPALVLRLEELGLFDRVKIAQIRPKSFGGEERTGFTIACQIR